MRPQFFRDLITAARSTVEGCYGLGGIQPSDEVIEKVKILQSLSNFLRKDPYAGRAVTAPASRQATTSTVSEPLDNETVTGAAQAEQQPAVTGQPKVRIHSVAMFLITVNYLSTKNNRKPLTLHLPTPACSVQSLSGGSQLSRSL